MLSPTLITHFVFFLRLETFDDQMTHQYVRQVVLAVVRSMFLSFPIHRQGVVVEFRIFLLKNKHHIDTIEAKSHLQVRLTMTRCVPDTVFPLKGSYLVNLLTTTRMQVGELCTYGGFWLC